MWLNNTYVAARPAGGTGLEAAAGLLKPLLTVRKPVPVQPWLRSCKTGMSLVPRIHVSLHVYEQASVLA